MELFKKRISTNIPIMVNIPIFQDLCLIGRKSLKLRKQIINFDISLLDIGIIIKNGISTNLVIYVSNYDKNIKQT